VAGARQRTPASGPGLPPIAPVTGWRLATRLPRDHYVRLDSNDYSVHPSAIGRIVQVAADLERVQITCDGRRAGEHPRCWAGHQSITDPAHAVAAAGLRLAHRLTLTRPADTVVEQRDLADYDKILDVSPARWS